jgi:hypothetical protein
VARGGASCPLVATLLAPVAPPVAARRLHMACVPVLMYVSTARRRRRLAVAGGWRARFREGRRPPLARHASIPRGKTSVAPPRICCPRSRPRLAAGQSGRAGAGRVFGARAASLKERAMSLDYTALLIYCLEQRARAGPGGGEGAAGRQQRPPGAQRPFEIRKDHGGRPPRRAVRVRWSERRQGGARGTGRVRARRGPPGRRQWRRRPRVRRCGGEEATGPPLLAGGAGPEL